MHVVRHTPNAELFPDDDDPIFSRGGEIIYQYKDLPFYVDIVYFDKDDYFKGNTTYFLTDIDEDPLSVQEYYDLSKEEVAQAIIDIRYSSGEHKVPVGVERFGISQDELNDIANKLATTLDLDIEGEQDSTEQDEDEQDEDEYWQYEYEQDEDEQDKDRQYEDEQDSTEQDEDEQDDADIKYGW